jgi:hypothetical protein
MEKDSKQHHRRANSAAKNYFCFNGFLSGFRFSADELPGKVDESAESDKWQEEWLKDEQVRVVFSLYGFSTF